MISKEATLVLDAQLRSAGLLFSRLAKDRTIQGDFSGPWKYRGGYLHFEEYVPGANARYLGKDPRKMSSVGGDLARVFALKEIARGLSHQTISHRLKMVRLLDKVITESSTPWDEVTVALLKRAVSEMPASLKDRTKEHMAYALANFATFMNGMISVERGITRRFNKQFLSWRPGAISTAGAPGERVEESDIPHSTYDQDIHKAIASARRAVIDNPDLEPKVGYDRIRLESLAFCLALGIRIGAMTHLAVNAVERDDASGQTFVRVPALKGEEPRVIAVPDIWDEAVWGAYSYLLEACADARARAAEIEASGFTFMRSMLSSYRASNPLSKGENAQIRVAGLDGTKHYFAKEVEECLGIARREFFEAYAQCATRVPEQAPALLVRWLDQRVANWDWHRFRWPKKSGGPCVNNVCGFAGVSNVTVQKAVYVGELRVFLSEVHSLGVGSDLQASKARKKKVAERWQKVREKMLVPWQQQRVTLLINIDALIRHNKTQYESALERHFQESLDDADDGVGLPSQTKPGVQAKLSEHLIVGWHNQFRSRARKRLLPMPLSREQIYSYLSASAGKITVFERLNILSDRGEPYSFGPHAIRRWVTTAILRAGLSQDSADLWMGRQVGRARNYDYRTPTERAEKLRALYITPAEPPDDFLGKRVMEWRSRGISDSEIHGMVDSKLRAVHFTPWGSCSRDLYVAPCEKGLMCLRGSPGGGLCRSFHVNKSDLVARAEIERLRSEHVAMLNVLDSRILQLRDRLTSELNSAEPLDQHLKYLVDVVRGCEEALSIYSE